MDLFSYLGLICRGTDARGLDRESEFGIRLLILDGRLLQHCTALDGWPLPPAVNPVANPKPPTVELGPRKLGIFLFLSSKLHSSLVYYS